MKLIKKIALGVCALAMCGVVFFGCSNAASGADNSLQTRGGSSLTSGSSSGYTEVWTGSQTIDWDANGLTIDHAKFTVDFDSLRITYNATAGGLKMAACDPWTDVVFSAASVSGASVDSADTKLIYPSTGDNQTVTVKLSSNEVAKIKGNGDSTGWGGLKIYGDSSITITKVESFKQ